MGKTTKQTTASGDEIEVTQNTGYTQNDAHIEDDDRLTDDALGDYQRRTQNRDLVEGDSEDDDTSE